MTLSDWLIVSLTAMGVLIIPSLTLIIKVTRQSTRTSDRLVNLTQQMQEDHESLDRRLRFMEEFWIRRGIGGNGNDHR